MQGQEKARQLRRDPLDDALVVAEALVGFAQVRHTGQHGIPHEQRPVALQRAIDRVRYGKWQPSGQAWQNFQFMRKLGCGIRALGKAKNPALVQAEDMVELARIGHEPRLPHSQLCILRVDKREMLIS